MKQLAPMKLLRCLLAAMLTLSLTFCSYDDSDLWKSVNGLSERLDQLEKSMQEEIDALKTIIEKLNQKEVTVDSAVQTGNGWTITFSDGTTVTIDMSGSGDWSPAIIVVEEEGDYWWAYKNPEGTVVFLTDQEGNRYYKVKNSWDTNQLYGGYFYVSVPYFLDKTISITVHKDAIPKDIARKFK